MTQVRRSQLISPFGSGALLTDEKGITHVTSAIDKWFPSTADSPTLDVDSFRVDEPRLSRRLGTDHFRLPPDFNLRRKKNAKLSIPSQRFPSWHFCPEPYCGLMRQASPTTDMAVYCENTTNHSGGKKVRMFQVRFVAMCDHGHMSDFPWREWVHRQVEPTCTMPMRLKAMGGAELSSIQVSCSCGSVSPRNMGGVLESNRDEQTTRLSTTLAGDGILYTCRGARPWAVVGDQGKGDCGRHIQGSLLNASNLYFGDTVSSIFLPPAEGSGISDELLIKVNDPDLADLRPAIKSGALKIPPARKTFRSVLKLREDVVPDEILDAAIGIVCGLREKPSDSGTDPGNEYPDEVAYRREEYEVLLKERSGRLLTIRDPGQENYSEEIRSCFSKVMLVERLRETRVLTGFTRVMPGGGPALTPEMKRDLLRAVPEAADIPSENWLPASLTYGEGIFIQFDEDQLRVWGKDEDSEARSPLNQRFDKLHSRYESTMRYQEGHLDGPRFVLIHTFAHLLINQLVFECGYSSASLRERLYVSSDPDKPMAGLLIYTAAGDSDGTMGGLVRSGEPANLEIIIRRALSQAEWCATDPICMEAGEAGQGPDSCNMAACHNCALIPETSCEEFNRFLDRGHVIGVEEKGISSFFTALL
ncbi:DUF1998 domain-containing protein [Hymenobacter perfusus]|uniref:DUF1998 domain-containing protein n=1 Tax=Hymenobacter perfusus TaxID=1236770 RepID=A0A3R9NW80_9BACT|nr:DUF1998 domain-containing protein [Hymenobacter perfusus]RSK38989.1 DUF1998 domain-containing protein [Hymenobacter perfusus]